MVGSGTGALSSWRPRRSEANVNGGLGREGFRRAAAKLPNRRALRGSAARVHPRYRQNFPRLVPRTAPWIAERCRPAETPALPSPPLTFSRATADAKRLRVPTRPRRPARGEAPVRVARSTAAAAGLLLRARLVLAAADGEERERDGSHGGDAHARHADRHERVPPMRISATPTSESRKRPMIQERMPSGAYDARRSSTPSDGPQRGRRASSPAPGRWRARAPRPPAARARPRRARS